MVLLNLSFFWQGIGGLATLLVGWIAKEYLLPVLSTERKKKLAEHILLIADDVTDYFRLKYPSADWSSWIDRAVDKIMEITGVKREVALRAVQAAISRRVSK